MKRKEKKKYSKPCCCGLVSTVGEAGSEEAVRGLRGPRNA